MKRSRIHPSHKTRYRVTNWRAYERGLIERGSITLYFTLEIVRGWATKRSGRRGALKRYSDAVIELALFLRLQYSLPWRQTEGFLQSLLRLAKLNHLHVPDHTTLSRRSRALELRLQTFLRSRGALHVVVDATGLQIFGQGEWAAMKHGRRGTQGWKKLHLGVESGGQLIAAELTEREVQDAAPFPKMLEAIRERVGRVTGDGAYDKDAVYKSVAARKARVVIPPKSGAVISKWTSPGSVDTPVVVLDLTRPMGSQTRTAEPCTNAAPCNGKHGTIVLSTSGRAIGSR